MSDEFYLRKLNKLNRVLVKNITLLETISVEQIMLSYIVTKCIFKLLTISTYDGSNVEFRYGVVMRLTMSFLKCHLMYHYFYAR